MYLLEGNLGAGKSTFLSLIQKHLPHLQTVTEPVATWHNAASEDSLLDHFYKDTPRWAYSMELFTLMTRTKEHLKEQKRNNGAYIPKIMERSLFSGYYCFARNGYEQGFLTYEEWIVYNEWFDFLVNKKCVMPQGFIYLQASPNICYQRMQKRSRSGEEIVPFEYLAQIHEQHERFLIHKANLLYELENVPVLVLDVSGDFANNPKQLQALLNKVDQFIQNHSSVITQSHTHDAYQL